MKESYKNLLMRFKREWKRRPDRVMTRAMGRDRVFHAYDLGPDTFVFERGVWKGLDEHASVLMADKAELRRGTHGRVITLTTGNQKVTQDPTAWILKAKVNESDEWTIIDSQDGDFTQNGGQQVMESFIKTYGEEGFDVVVCHNDNEAYGAMDAMDAAGIKYGVDGKIIISFDATHEGLQRTLDGKILCNVECNPIQAVIVMNVIKALQAGEPVEKFTLVPDEGFCAPGITSEIVTTMTDEVLAGRKY